MHAIAVRVVLVHESHKPHLEDGHVDLACGVGTGAQASAAAAAAAAAWK